MNVLTNFTFINYVPTYQSKVIKQANYFNFSNFFHPIDARALKSERLAFQSCLTRVIGSMSNMELIE